MSFQFQTVLRVSYLKGAPVVYNSIQWTKCRHTSIEKLQLTLVIKESHANFNHVNKIEARQKVLTINQKLTEVHLYAQERPFMHCLYFICERKFYARTHVKIARHWNSTLSYTQSMKFPSLSKFLPSNLFLYKSKSLQF